MCPPETSQVETKGIKSMFDFIKGVFSFGKAKYVSPALDPFYGYNATHAELEQYPPGSILRFREIEVVAFFNWDKGPIKAWQVCYRTTSALGEAQNTVATVLLPPDAKINRLVCYAPKTDSSAPICRTSYSFVRDNNEQISAAGEQIFLQPLLEHGYPVVMPDYEGQTDAFGAGIQSGRAMLDSIRAAFAFGPLGLQRAGCRVGGWGYSGGALATGWAAQLQQTYAADLNDVICTWSLGGTPVNLDAVARRVNNTMASGLIVGVLQGLANAYPELNQWLTSIMNKQGQELFKVAQTQCFKSIMLKAVRTDVLGLTKNEVKEACFTTLDPLTAPLPTRICHENFMGLSEDPLQVPKVPMLIMQSLLDEVVPYKTVDDLVDRWGKKGASISYVRDKASGHVILIFTGLPRALQWMYDRLEGVPCNVQPGSPKIETVLTSLLDDGDDDTISPSQREKVNESYIANKDLNWWNTPKKSEPAKSGTAKA